VKNNEFSPATIAAHVGDTISVNFLAEDKDYDFTQPDLGLSAKLLKGKNQLIQVSPTQTGKFTFYCASCGGPAKGPVGYLVVAPKQ
jgi:plastocyanin